MGQGGSGTGPGGSGVGQGGDNQGGLGQGGSGQAGTPGTAGSGSGGSSIPPANDPRRLFLTGDVLASLRARAAAGDPAWTALKARCDSFLNGQVYWPEPKGDPDVSDYPPAGSIGQGYQGDGYINPLQNLGLCHQVTRISDPASSAAYGAKGVDILIHMSDPPGAAHYQDPLRDDGYGIRNFGIGMAFGYDWLHDSLDSGQQARVVAALDLWVSVFESGGFLPKFPMANYFAGYFAAKGLAALATDGENAPNPTMWADWMSLYTGLVQPYYAKNLEGGGWAEGWVYGEGAAIDMQYPVVAALGAKGIDLVSDPSAPFPYVAGQGQNLVHFTWPSHVTLDDRGLIYASPNPSGTRSDVYTRQAGLLALTGAADAATFHSFARVVRTTSGTPTEPWEEFLFWNDAAPETDYATLPTSFLAKGMNQVAMRSSWSTDATFASFASGPYVGSADSGEELYDQGSLAIVHGANPFVVNAPGFLKRDMPGVDSEWDNQVYESNYYGSPPPRTLYNIFYNKPGGQDGVGPAKAATHIAAMEDTGAYVFSRGVQLEALYSDAKGISAWSRDVLFIRPSTFLVHDRTTTTDTSGDQRMAFHVARTPASVAGGRIDVADGATFLGSVTAVLPSGNTTTTVDALDSHKAYRIEVRPSSPVTENRWLTVLDASASAAEAATATALSTTAGNVLSGAVHGALLSGSVGTRVVLFADTTTLAPVSGMVAYISPNGAEQLIADLSPGAAYSVTAAQTVGGAIVTIVPGGSMVASAAGLLHFKVGPAGEIAPL